MKRNTCQGNILIVALIVVLVISGFVLNALTVTSNGARMADRSYNYALTQAAAEGSVEYAYGVWKSQILAQDKPLSTTWFSALTPSQTFSSVTPTVTPTDPDDGSLKVFAVDEYGAPMPNAGDNPTGIAVDVDGYPGWRGFTYNYVARAKYKPSGGYAYKFAVGVKRQFQYSTVPLFQSMWFFENDLTIYKAATMNVTGLVHTNADAYISSSAGNPVSFANNVSYAGNYTETNDPPFASTWSGWVQNAELPPTYPNGAGNQVHKVDRMEPIGTDPASVLDTTDANPNNDSLHELIEVPNTSFTDPPKLAPRRFYNKAGIVMKITNSTITVTAQNGTTLTPAKITELKATVTAQTTIYDQREGKSVDVSNVDVGKVTTALSTTGVGGFNNVLYIYDDTAPVTGNLEPKTVRLVNGGVLPAAGLTVASENPIYVQGDYNTGTTVVAGVSTYLTVPANNGGNVLNLDSPTVPTYTRKPAAVIGDAVMLLSNAWSDTNANKTLSNRVAVNTTYNMAMLSGFMPSGYQPTSGAQYGYSGGAINYPRFLEDWDNKYCTYFGSMVQLFQSKTFTGEWDTGVIYRPPDRQFNFDNNFTANPPAGSLNATTLTRSTWVKY